MEAILHTRIYQSECGQLQLGAIGGKICMCDWTTNKYHEHLLAKLKNAAKVRSGSESASTKSGSETAIAKPGSWAASTRSVSDAAKAADTPEDRDSAVLELASRQLDEYFSGTRRQFSLPLQFLGSDFQKSVWEEIKDIPYGAIISYKDLARKTGRPSAVRAVGHAVGMNPISIIIPCHRVIVSDGRLTGYAGGVEAKKKRINLGSIEAD